VGDAGACAAPFQRLAAVAIAAGDLAVEAAAELVAVVAVIAVAAPASQALERAPGRLPVAAAAGRLPAGLGAQQPLGIDRVPPAGRHGRSPLVVAAPIDADDAATAARLLAAAAGLLYGGPRGRRSGPPIPGLAARTMLRRRFVVEAVRR
jgi:hypothetical protein